MKTRVHLSEVKPLSRVARLRRPLRMPKRRGRTASTALVGGPRIGNELAKTLRRLAKLGWLADGDRYVSPHSKISYGFEEACRIEDIAVPSEHPNNVWHKWLFD